MSEIITSSGTRVALDYNADENIDVLRVAAQDGKFIRFFQFNITSDDRAQIIQLLKRGN